MSKHATLPSLFGAIALALTLVLVGCAAPEAEDTQTEATDQVAGEGADTDGDSSTDTTFDVPAAFEGATDVVRSMATSEDAPSTQDFDTLPRLELDAADAIDDDSDIATGTEEDPKASSGYVTMIHGGMQMTIPSNWLVTQDEDGWVMMPQDQSLIGYMYSYDKPVSTHYDVEAMAKSVPGDALSKGWTNISILGYSTGYSDRDTLCGAWILYVGTYRGQELIHYCHFIESRSYINIVEFICTTDGFNAHVDEISDATDSLCFSPSEVI